MFTFMRIRSRSIASLLAAALVVGCAASTIPTWREAQGRWGWAVALQRVGYDCVEGDVAGCDAAARDRDGLGRREARREAYDAFLVAFPTTVRIEVLKQRAISELLEDEVPADVDDDALVIAARLETPPLLPPHVELRILELKRFEPLGSKEPAGDPEEVVVALGGAPIPSSSRVYGWTSPPSARRYREARLARPIVLDEQRYEGLPPRGTVDASRAPAPARPSESAFGGASRVGLPELPILVVLLPLVSLESLTPSRGGGTLDESSVAWLRALDVRRRADLAAWVRDPRVEARLRLCEGTWRDGTVATLAYARHPLTAPPQRGSTPDVPPRQNDQLAVVISPVVNGVPLAPMRVWFKVPRKSDLRSDLASARLGPVALRGAYDLLLPRPGTAEAR
jgi:hypothetical protein